MVKYRGKVDGKPRGPYTSRVLEALIDVPMHMYNEPGDFFLEKVDAYLAKAGHCLLVVDKGDTVDGFYHFGGASIYAHYAYRWERPSQEDRFRSLLQFVLCSNESLADVTEKLKQRFPFLEGPREKSEYR